MANKKINQLVSKTAILSTDIFGIGDATTGQLFKKTIAELQAAIGGAVISVNGLVGTVVLDTDDIQELATPTNKYFTDARARGAISLTVTGNSGASTYSSGTGVLNVPTYTLAGLGGISATFLSGTSGISYNSSTGVISYSGTVYTDASIRALLSAGTGISYNSSTGAISYSGTVYTDASVRALISITTTGDSGASTYNNTTGVINVPNYTLAGLGGISYTSLSGGTGITYNNTTGAISYSGTVYTDASVRALVSAGTGLTYNSSTGVFTSSITQYTDALARASVSLTTTGTSGASTYNSTTGVFNIPQYQAVLTNPVTGTGTSGYHAKWTSSSVIGNSVIYDNGTSVGIGTTSPNLINSNIALSINGTSNAVIEINRAGVRAGFLYVDSVGFAIQEVRNLPMIFATNDSEKMRIKSNGNVGIGTSVDIDHKLKVAGIVNSANGASDSVGGGAAYLLDGSATNGSSLTFLQQGVSKFAIWTYDGSNWGQRMAITSDGIVNVNKTLKVGIGDNPTNHVIINENEIKSSNNAALFIQANSSGKTMINVGSGNILLGTQTDNGEKLYVSGSIRATGSITANSDISLKKNLLKIENALEKVEQINGYTYELKADDSKRHAGVIAQEIQRVLPEIVNTGNDGLMGVEYGNISALLIEAIKEQQTQIKDLQALLNK
jgi:hypothetical protein